MIYNDQLTTIYQRMNNLNHILNTNKLNKRATSDVYYWQRIARRTSLLPQLF